MAEHLLKKESINHEEKPSDFGGANFWLRRRPAGV